MSSIAFSPSPGPVNLRFNFSINGVDSPSDKNIGAGTWTFSTDSGGIVDGTLFDRGNNFSHFLTLAGGTHSITIRAGSTKGYNPSRTGTVAMVENIVIFGTYHLLLPNVDIAAGTFRTFYIGSRGTDCAAANHFELFTSNTYGSRVGNWGVVKTIDNDDLPFSDSVIKNGYHKLQDTVLVSEQYRMNPRRYPVENVSFSDSITIRSIRVATITGYQFKPTYRIYEDLNGDGTFATTNWAGKVQSFGNIRKSVKHWTGDYEVGNWQPQLNDPNNELWGSLYGSTLEPRYKEIRLSAMISDTPLTYTIQYAGLIQNTDWQDGKVSFDTKDKMKDLPNRDFVWDYANIGSTDSGGKVWGVVKKVSGTIVNFDDNGAIKYVEVKQESGGFWDMLVSAVVGGAIGFVGGGPAGAAIGFSSGLINNQSRETKRSYYQVFDYNAIPDDSVSAGQKVKFYSGSINGQATNLSSPLAQRKEYSIVSGTFVNGFAGTFGFDNVDGINVGDYVYIRKQMFFSGSPNDIIRALLTGSNINYPYFNGGSVLTSKSSISGGVVTPVYKQLFTDFATTWDSELESNDLLSLQKFIKIDSESTPFEEVKQLVADINASFYINELNKFAIKPVRPRGLLSVGNEATYTESRNILSGFRFSRSVDEVNTGVRIYYGYIGNELSAFKNGYNRLIEVQSKNPMSGVTQWKEIESRWLQRDDDAKYVAWKILSHTEHGVDRVTIPTTLYGVIHNVSDVIRVTHRTGSLTNRLFEIESYDKSFDDSKVTLEAVDVQRTYGYGNTLWTGTSIAVNTGTQSGFSYQGLNGSLRRLGSISGTLLAWDTFVTLGNTSSALGLYGLNGAYIAFGSLSSQYVEICKANFNFNRMTLVRGLFNTVRRTYFTDEPFYLIGASALDSQGNYLINQIINKSFRTGTAHNINSNLGTSFKFF